MRNLLKSSTIINRTSIFLLGIFLGVGIFGVIAWQVSARGESDNTERDERASSIAGDPDDPDEESERESRRSGERESKQHDGQTRFHLPGDPIESDEDEKGGDGDEDAVSDSPPDTKHYWRLAIPADNIRLPSAPAAVQMSVIDAVVSNSNPALQNTDTAGDSETNIAINPANPNEIVITAFSGGFNSAPLWHSTNGGATWTERFTLPRPPNAPGTNNQCPCDQSIDYGRGNRMSGTILSLSPTDVYTGTTTDPTQSASWQWLLSGGTAVKTNSQGAGNSDQPWLLVNRDTGNPAQDNVYVAYDDFTTSPVNMQVAVAGGSNPPSFTSDINTGQAGGGINPGHRLAVDSSNGWVWDLFQRATGGDDTARTINYRLNRSTDGGQNWSLNGSSSGAIIATADSTQPYTKFGGVNALLGGVDAAAVDPASHALYYVYGNRDGTGNNRLAIRRITDAGGGNVNIGAENFVTTSGQAAIPSVAVNSDGVVAVFYYTYDGMSGGFPQFTAHVAMSADQGATFPAGNHVSLETFLSPATDDGQGSTTKQRVLGDYQQIKSVGRAFFGSFTGNGVPFGRAASNLDPIFYKVALAQSNTTTTVATSGSPSVFGQPVTFTANVTSAGGIPTGTVSFLDGATAIAACQNVPLLAGQAQCQNVNSLSVAGHTINAQYNGDVAYNTSAGSVAQTVNKAATTTALTSAPNSSQLGQNVTFTATISVTAPGAGTPGGNVSFRDNGVNIGSCAARPVAANVATCSISTLTAGSHPITALYNGDGNFNSSLSNTVNQIVVAPPVIAKAFNPTAIGQTSTTTLTLTITNPSENTVAETGVAVTDNLPVGLLVATPNGLTNTCGGAAVATAGSGTITLTGGTIAVNSSCTLTVSILGNVAGDYVNTTGSVSSTNGGTGNTASANLSVIASDLAITKTDGVASAPAGSPVTYTIIASNLGPSNAVGATVVDTFPAAIINAQWTCASSAGSLCGAASGTGNINQTVNILVGGTVTYTVAATTSPSATGNLVNTATVLSPAVSYDPNPANNTSTDVDTLLPPSVFVIDDVQLFEGQAGTTAFNFRITKTGATGFATTVQYQTQDGTATVANNDYVSTGGTLNFGPFETQKVVTVQVIGDSNIEPNETFFVRLLNNPVNALVGDGGGQGTIFNDDPAATPTPTPVPTPTPTPANRFEGDINRTAVGVPGTGDGDVTVADQIQYLRFLNGTDCPSTNEQPRLDAGPRTTLGDGSLGAADGTAIDAYARHDALTDFDPNTPGWQPTPVGGNAAISNLGCTPSAAPEGDTGKAATVEPASATAARVVRVVSRSGARNADIFVDVEMTAQGNEAGTQYGLHFDPSVLAISSISGVNTNPDVMLGAGAPAGTTLNVNADDAANGNIGIVENFSAAALTALPEGSTRIARVKFHVLDSAAAGTSKVDFDSSVISGATSDINGFVLSSNYEGGDVSVSSSRGVTVTGRVTSSDGRGIRGATVTIVDGDGFARSVTTSSFGYYTFDDVAAATYTVAVSSRQYRYASRTVDVGDDLTEINFTGLE